MRWTLRRIVTLLRDALRGPAPGPRVHPPHAEGPIDLTGIAGSWVDDPEFDAALADLHRVDDELWTS